MTLFSKLSIPAQTLIVDAILGKYDFAKPPDIPESVRTEIINWAQTREPYEPTADSIKNTN